MSVHFAFALGQTVDLEALGRLANQQRARLSTNAAAWRRIRISPPDLMTSVVRDARRKRISVFSNLGTELMEMFQVTQRDGCWYVEERRSRRKYKPFEAPFWWPGAYQLMQEAEGDLFYSPSKLAGAEFVVVQNGIAVFRRPLSKAMQAAQEAGILTLRQAMQGPRFAQVLPETRLVFTNAIVEKESNLRNGFQIKVDLSTGLLLEFEEAGARGFRKDFRWLEASPERDFEVDDRVWEDKRFSPSEKELDECILLRGSVSAMGDDRDESFEPHILNLRTTDVHRVPFAGDIMPGGCFLKDRSEVIIFGRGFARPDVRPHLINLAAGSQRAMGGAWPAADQCRNFVLSNDGKTVAFLQSANYIITPKNRIHLLDLATEQARPVGEPASLHLSSWLPGDRGLLGHTPVAIGVNEPATPNICLIDLEGNVRLVRGGSYPVLFSGSERILYLDWRDQLWHTCDMKGQAAKLFHDGLPNHHYPTMAPDGKRVMLVKRAPNQPAQLFVYEEGDGAAKAFKLPAGHWDHPVWK